jgi:histidyl-tRNA synthetase
MAEKLSSVKGMPDVLPPASGDWEWLEGKVRALMARYGYANIRTPIVEYTPLFVRGLGEVTDIVEKEMYSWQDALNGEHLSLRPENTAGVVRAVVEHSMLHDGGKRLWYQGPMFRHERPQRGRYRQFHQIGAEAIGFAGPDVDAELILMARALWHDLGLKDVTLEINSLGQAAERKAHRDALIAYFEARREALDSDSQRRLHTNPLRILDSKNPAMQSLIDDAPKLLSFLGSESRAHFDGVTAVLDAVGQDYVVNPRLVRGMDYYNLTVFEWTTTRLGSQGTICGGGRYDGLIGMFGSKPAPAVGWALGVERVLELLREGGLVPPASPPIAYAVVPDDSALRAAQVLGDSLRGHGVSVLMNAGGGSFKTQMKRADQSGAAVALIFGEAELASGLVAVKPLRQLGAEQKTWPLADGATLAAHLLSR